jgi:hypothetical protein
MNALERWCYCFLMLCCLRDQIQFGTQALLTHHIVRTNLQPVKVKLRTLSYLLSLHIQHTLCDEFRIESGQVHHRGQESTRDTFIYIHC